MWPGSNLGERVVFVKREHLVGVRTRVRNWRAGFGLVSRAEREATTLQRLEAAGLPAPRWLAVGTHGGQAVLIVDGVPDADPLTDIAVSPADRRRRWPSGWAGSWPTPTRPGSAPRNSPPSTSSSAGGRTPITLLDWQSAPPPGPVPVAARVRQLAEPSRHPVRGCHRPAAVAVGVPPGVGQQNEAAPPVRRVGASRLCAEADSAWPAVVGAGPVAAGRPGPAVGVAGRRGGVRPAPNSPPAGPTRPTARRFTARPTAGEDPTTAMRCWCGGTRSTRSAGCGRPSASGRGGRRRPKAARVLFHLARFDIPGPRLLAFGQKLTGWASAESFLLYEPATPARRGTNLGDLRAADLEARPVRTGTRTGRVASPFAVRLRKRRGR